MDEEERYRDYNDDFVGAVRFAFILFFAFVAFAISSLAPTLALALALALAFTLAFAQTQPHHLSLPHFRSYSNATFYVALFSSNTLLAISLPYLLANAKHSFLVRFVFYDSYCALHYSPLVA